MPFRSDKERRGFYGSQTARGSPFPQSSTTVQEKKHLFSRVLNYSKDRKIKHEEQERIKALNKKIENDKREAKESALQKTLHQIQAKKQRAKDIRDDKIDLEEEKRSRKTSKKPVLPKGMNTSKQPTPEPKKEEPKKEESTLEPEREQPTPEPEVEKDEPTEDKNKDDRELPYARLSPYLYSD